MNTRLIILFSKTMNPNYHFSTDIVLGNGFTDINDNGYANFYDLAKIPLRHDFTKLFEEQFKEYSEKISNPLLRHIYSSNKLNIFMRSYLPLLKYLNAIDYFVKEMNVKEIVLSDYLNSGSYTPFYESEGEVSSTFLYKQWDFIPFHLFHYCKSKGIEVKIINHKSRFTFLLRRFLRRYLFLILKLGKHFLNHMRHPKYEKADIKSFSADLLKPLFLISTRNVIQSEFVLEFIKAVTPNYFLMVSERQFSYGENYIFLKKVNPDHLIHEQQVFSYALLLKIFFKIVKNLLKKKEPIRLEFNNVIINFDDIQSELYISYFELALYEEFLDKCIPLFKAYNKIIISLEMLSEFPYAINNAGNKNAAKTVQFQTMAIFKQAYPDFISTDLFVFNALEYKEYFSSVFSHDKLAFLGCVKYGTVVSNKKAKSKKLENVIFFTQPIDYDVQKKVIDALYALSLRIKFNLFIKPHPRDKSIDYSAYPGIRIVENDIPISTFISGMDLALTRTSAVGLDFYIYDIPALFCLFSEFAQAVNTPYIDKAYYGICYSVKDMEEKIMNYPLLIEKFEKHREYMLDKNQLYYDHEKFINGLLNKLEI